MSGWEWLLLALVVCVALYAALVAWLVVAGRREDARAAARFVPDAVVLFRRLLGDPRVPRRRKLVLLALVAYLASPIDLVPDFVPVAGYLDDAVLVALALRYVLRGAAAELVDEHWPGPPSSRDAVVRLAGLDGTGVRRRGRS
ncbi:MAG: YkvA family protein [Pseudomonadota bacterium]